MIIIATLEIIQKILGFHEMPDLRPERSTKKSPIARERISLKVKIKLKIITERSAGKDNKQDGKVKQPVVMVRHKVHNAILLIHEPVDEGMTWIERSDGQRLCVTAGELLLEGIRPAS